MKDSIKGGIVLLCIIIFIVGVIVFGVKSIKRDNEIENSKISFCNLNEMEFRTKHCGFGCWEDQCYGSGGVFELEESRKGYVLIGYPKEQYALQNEVKE